MTSPHSFAIGADNFELDGAPFRILAGSIHYSRVHPDLWADRIHKAKLMGLNTIETYIMWNFHSTAPGEYRWDGWRDLGAFLDLVQAEGMYAIVRPGPYACAEWDNGGLPTWLTSDPRVVIRTSEPNYVAAVEEYLREVGAIVAPRMIDAGGPIILMQVENEYGAYGSDKHYLRRLVEIYREVGITVPLTTVDQPTDQMLSDGSIEGVHLTGSFGGRVAERLSTLRRHQPSGPLMCAEFWIGWFDHWGAHHHTTSLEDSTTALRELLAAGASVTIYMFHGGTNFGLTNGANDKGSFQPTITSYDYDALLAEDGSPTAKYWAFRDVIAETDPVPAEAPAERIPAPVVTVPLVRAVSLLDAVTPILEPVVADQPLDYEELGVSDGLVLYRREVELHTPATLVAPRVHDRAQVFLDGTAVGVLAREEHDRALALPAGSGTLSVLVENQGRVNYGPRLGEPKGLGPVSIVPDGATAADVAPWWSAPVPLDARVLAPLLSAGYPLGSAAGGPLIAGATFDLPDAVADLFLDSAGWGRGFVFINDFFVGRYSSAGPQRTLYVPAPVLTSTGNKILVVELTAFADTTVRFVAEPDLGHTDF